LREIRMALLEPRKPIFGETVAISFVICRSIPAA
jgi:hypothetical protein